MDTTDCEALISAVSKRPGLYDKSNRLYSDRQYAVQAWKEISEETNLEETRAKRKWTNLRDYFQRQLRDTLFSAKSVSTTVKKRKWLLYDSMSFLTKYLTDRPTSCNLQKSSRLNRPFVTVTNNGGDQVDEVTHPTLPQAPPTLEMSTVASSSVSTLDAESAPKRKYASKPRNESQLRDREILETLLKNIQPTTTVEEDEDFLFFKNLVPKMKCMTDIQKLELQSEINHVFLKHLKRATDTSPSGHIDSKNVYSESSTRPDVEHHFQYEQP